MNSPSRIAVWSAIAIALFLLPGCPPEDEPSGNGAAEKPADPAGGNVIAEPARGVEPLARVLLIEFDEANTDTFTGPLGTVDDAEDTQAFEVHDGQVIIGQDELDNDPGVPLTECRLLVVYRIHYGGVGRSGVDTRRYAFANLPGTINLPPTPAGDSWTHTPDDTGLFSLNVRNIRPMPAGANSIELNLDGDAVTAALGGQMKTIQPSESADWPETSRTIAVRERGLTAADVDWEEGPPGDNPKIDSTDVDYGRVTFTARLTVTNRGSVPVFDRDPAPPEDL